MNIVALRALLAAENYEAAATAGAVIFPLLIELESDDDDCVKYGTCCVFEANGAAGVDYLLARLEGGSRAAVWILGEMRTSANYIRPA